MAHVPARPGVHHLGLVQRVSHALDRFGVVALEVGEQGGIRQDLCQRSIGV